MLPWLQGTIKKGGRNHGDKVERSSRGAPRPQQAIENESRACCWCPIPYSRRASWITFVRITVETLLSENPYRGLSVSDISVLATGGLGVCISVWYVSVFLQGDCKGSDAIESCLPE